MPDDAALKNMPLVPLVAPTPPLATPGNTRDGATGTEGALYGGAALGAKTGALEGGALVV